MENAKRKPRESFIDMIWQSLTWTRKLSIQLYLAHVARKKETKTNKCQYTFNSIHPRRQSSRNNSDYGGKDLWKRWVLSLEWKVEGVIDCDNEDDDCDEVICTGWSEPGGDWKEWGWWNEEWSWFHRWGDAYLKERLMICNDEDTGGRAFHWPVN